MSKHLPTRLVQSIHFEDFDGKNFERLIFAYHVRAECWLSLEWYGQTGSDLGRDIWGVRLNDQSGQETVCIQCANRKTPTATKAIADIDKAIVSSNGKPGAFRFVCASNVSAKLRDKIQAHAKNKGIYHCEIWSGAEFEEHLRGCAESLLKRFTEGEVFPDSSKELKGFSQLAKPADDHEILALFAQAFDRPAFFTHFNSESSLPAFRQAISDTIQVLNTGIWQTRDGTEIKRIPSRHMIQDAKTKLALKLIGDDLVRLRARFDELIKSGEIKPCGCKVPDCPIFMLSSRASMDMDRIRHGILSRFSRICPEFTVKFGSCASSSW